MTDNTTQLVNQAQDATRSIHQTIQDLMGVQMNVVQRLGEVQQKAFNQAVEATNAQFQLLNRTRDPREFASGQADLVQEYGQRYVDCANQAIDITVQAWQEYGDRLEKTVNTVTDRAQRAASPRKVA
ncbi:MAG: phasin family protein [Gammaproteobacteria bacterium]